MGGGGAAAVDHERSKPNTGGGGVLFFFFFFFFFFLLYKLTKIFLHSNEAALLYNDADSRRSPPAIKHASSVTGTHEQLHSSANTQRQLLYCR